jgi:hypothetical protein
MQPKANRMTTHDEVPLTVAELISRLQACDPAAYPCVDDNNGFPLEVVGVSTANETGDPYHGRLHADQRDVAVVWLGLRGEAAAHAALQAAMAAHIASRSESADNAVGNRRDRGGDGSGTAGDQLAELAPLAEHEAADERHRKHHGDDVADDKHENGHDGAP